MKVKIFSVLLMIALILPTMAQDDEAVNPVEMTLSGTPSEICDAATPAIEPETRSYSSAEQVLEAGIDYRAVMCTSAGAVYIDLFESLTPLTVNNFVFLAEQNYYNNTIFHRVMVDFMAQAGDPTGTGAGGPGYQFGDEFVSFVTFDRPGLLAMANSGPATNGSQFFITTVETPWLNGAHTIFGEVLEGQAETVDNILIRDPQAGGDSTTLDAVVIIRDPELVDSTYVDTREAATAEIFVAGLDSTLSPDNIPPDVVFTGAEILDTDTVAAIAPDELSSDYATFLETYGHDYRVTALLDNPECNTEYFFYTMSYSVDAFASAADASAALDDPFLAEYYESVGYMAMATEEDVDLPYNAYFTSTDICNATGQTVTLDLLRGRYLLNISVIFSTDGNPEADIANFVATTVPTLFEAGLADAYRSEVR